MIEFDGLEAALEDLLGSVRSWRIEYRLSVSETARLSGVAESTLRRMDAPDWAPSATTLRSVLRMIDAPAGRLLAASRRLAELSDGVAPFGCAEGISCVGRRGPEERLRGEG